jgi:flagellar basal-body rod protein FlgG
MIRSLWNAASGMQAGQLRVEVAAHNLANVNTPGYRRVQTDFADLLYQSFAGDRLNVGNGVRPLALARDLAPGAIEQTGNPLDLAVIGNGFMIVERDDGSPAYTRDGSFRLDAVGRIVTASGLPLVIERLDPEAEPFSPQGPGEFTIGLDGAVAWQPGEGDPVQVGHIRLAMPVSTVAGRDPDMVSLGGNLYLPATGADAEILPAGEASAGQIRQGCLERSNVSLADEMVEMIIAQRAYQLSARAVQAADTMLALANGIRRG